MYSKDKSTGFISASPPAIPEDGAPRSLWHSRGYLPHFEGPHAVQHVTFHLADSLPKSVLQRLDSELKTAPSTKRDAERRKRIEAWIDAGHGSCLLRDASIAEMIQQSLLFFDAERYRMLAWVVMPNHVHTLFQPINGWSVASIVTSWKKFTARQIGSLQRSRPAPTGNADLPIGGFSANRIWHREYWDRYIRNQHHLARTIDYIHANPVNARLAPSAEQWPWSSAAR